MLTNETRQKLLLKCVLIAVGVLLIAWFLYRWPQKIEIHASATGMTSTWGVNDPTDTVEVILKVKKYRYLCKPSRFEGQIVFDGAEYTSVYEVLRYFSNGTEKTPLLTNLKAKLSGAFQYALFVTRDAETKNGGFILDSVQITEWSKEEVMLLKRDTKGTGRFYRIQPDP